MFTIIVILCILSYIIRGIMIYIDNEEIKNPFTIIQLIITTIILYYGLIHP